MSKVAFYERGLSHTNPDIESIEASIYIDACYVGEIWWEGMQGWSIMIRTVGRVGEMYQTWEEAKAEAHRIVPEYKEYATPPLDYHHMNPTWRAWIEDNFGTPE